MLKMKAHCERCKADTGLLSEAYICSFECTFCASCTTEMHAVCPNCSGNLTKRPTRARSPLNAGIAQLKRKLFGK